MTHARPYESTRRGVSLWAIILIAAGVLWLLGDANILSGANFSVLLRVWPLILIGFGLHMLLGRQSPTLSLLIGGALLLLIVGLMIVGPSIGLAAQIDAVEEHFSEPIEDAESARIELGLGVGSTTLNALDDGSMLFDADLRHVGEVEYRVNESGDEKIVTLTQNESSGGSFTWFGLPFTPEDQLYWHIGLTDRVPLALQLNGGVGEAHIDLTDIQLTELDYNGGVGATTLILPEGTYDASVNIGVGELSIRLVEGAVTTLDLNGGVGGVVLDLPDDAPIRVETHGGLGGVDSTGFLERVDGDNDNGIWESASYAEASAGERIVITYNGGVGGLDIR